MDKNTFTSANNTRIAKSLFGPLTRSASAALKKIVAEYNLSIAQGDLTYLANSWYVTHAGLLRLARRRRCCGIHTRLLLRSSDPTTGRWIFKATVFTSRTCKGFVGYGDADPSNVSALVHGAELRIAETRAVNRALRKAYGIGTCSVEELGCQTSRLESHTESKKLSPQPANGNGGGPKIRDRLCQIIRQHQLDATLVKSYATHFCGVNALRDASREQVEKFVVHLADCAEKDRSALLSQLNSYVSRKEGAA